MKRSTVREAGALPEVAVSILCAGLMACAILAIFFMAPTETTMGAAQRIMYVHVPVAWIGLLGFVIAAVAACGYLTSRRLDWDQWLQSAIELGWLGSTLTLITGSLWARSAWNTWWTWDPRLTSASVLWAIYSATLIIRRSQDDPHRRARISAALAIVGLSDVPMVIMATRWFRGIHPVAPQMEPIMRGVLLLSAVSVTAFFAVLLLRRRAQLHAAGLLASLEQRAGS